MSLAPGSRIGPYEILAPIGAGGMGEVFRARDTRLKRDVALKMLPEVFAADPSRMARFQREAEVLASLNHPNIAQIYGVEERGLAMELVEGASPKGPLPFDEAWEICLQIAAALDYAHERGIVHRDLKPDNIKVTSDGVVKLLDFGLAKAFDEPPDLASNPANSPTLTLHATIAGTIMGTAGYMAPEQAKGKRVDKRADIWAWGVVLYELLTGEPLFMGDGVAESLSNVLTRQPDLQRVPPQVRKLLSRVLEKDPKLRLRDIGEAAHLLDSEVSAPAAQPARPRFAGAAWAVAGILALAAAGLGYVAYRHSREEEARVIRLFLPPPENTTYSVLAGIPTVSPDGRQIAFVGSAGGRNSLWVRSLDAASSRELPGTEEARYPFWSPDSKAIGFFAGGKLKRIAAEGGPPLALCDAPIGFGGSWSAHDVIVFAPYSSGGLSRIPAGGGAPTPLTELKKEAGELSHRFPWFLPDGRHVLFTARNANSGSTTVSIADIDSKDYSTVVTLASNVAFSQSGHLLFLRDRTLVAQSFDLAKRQATGDAVALAREVLVPQAIFASGQFSVSQNGVLAYLSGGRDLTQLTWFDRSGSVQGTVGKPAETTGMALSPDEKIVAVDRRDPQAGRIDIWTYDLASGNESRLTFGDGNSIRPVWSHDGGRIGFTNTRGSMERYYAKQFGSSANEELIDQGAFGVRGTDWSRDGRYLVERRADPKTTFDIWILPMFGERKAFPYLNSESREDEGRLSPNGQWLAYGLAEPSEEVYVQSFPKPGGKWQISSGGGTRPVWARDGRALYYISTDGKMMEVKVGAGSNFEFSKPAPLFAVKAPLPIGFSVDSKGRFLIPVQLDDAPKTPLSVVLNWQAALKR